MNTAKTPVSKKWKQGVSGRVGKQMKAEMTRARIAGARRGRALPVPEFGKRGTKQEEEE